MILRLKFLCAALIRFVCQWRVRPIGNNLRLLFNSIGIIFSRRVSNAQYATKHRLNTAILKRDLAYRPSDLATQPCEKPRVWTFWWQGEEAMPEIIRATVDSIRRAAGDKEMVLITKDNYADYVQIPAYILNKVNGGALDYLIFQTLYAHLYSTSMVVFGLIAPSSVLVSCPRTYLHGASLR